MTPNTIQAILHQIPKIHTTQTQTTTKVYHHNKLLFRISTTNTTLHLIAEPHLHTQHYDLTNPNSIPKLTQQIKKTITQTKNITYYQSKINPKTTYAAIHNIITAQYNPTHQRWIEQGTYRPIRNKIKINWTGPPYTPYHIDKKQLKHLQKHNQETTN